MNNPDIFGRVIATENKPTTTTALRFWVSDTTLLRPFDVVKVPHVSRKPGGQSFTYAIVQELEHLTDAIGYLSGVVSSDFGDVNTEPRNIRLGTTVATAEVLYNTEDIEMPVRDGSAVMWADREGVTEALGLRGIKQPLPAGYFSMSNDVEIPIHFEGDFVVGPEGAHVNISGISGLATKTSYAMFLMCALQQKRMKDVSLVIFNVKGGDLLNIDQPNVAMSEHEKKEWHKCGLEPRPFDNVTYFHPYSKKEDRLCTQSTTVPRETLEDQISRGVVHNYFYDVESGKNKLELLFADVDDPQSTMEQCAEQMKEKRPSSWSALVEDVEEMTKKSQDRPNRAKGQEIPVVSWRRFYRFLQQRVKNDIFDEVTSSKTDVRRKVYVRDIVRKIKPGHVVVVDIQPLPDYLQSLVFGDVIRQIQSAKMGDDEELGPTDDMGRVVIFADELNKYAPKREGNDRALTRTILEVTERGRSLGMVLFGAEQFRSGVHQRVLGNCSTNIMGRTNSVEVTNTGDYRFLTGAQKATLTRLPKGTLLLQHAAFSTSTIKARFPVPAYSQPK
ncbi:MAG: ATP-binding protein [Magnetococcales bacterium]|nr:ATP-binding protein [Magnetococcales bacterium]